MMFVMWEDDVKREIQRSAKNALNFLERRWTFEVELVCHRWQINFFDEGGHSCTVISFERPPNADEVWYTQEIIRRLQDELDDNNQ